MKILIGIDDSACSAAALDFVKSMSWPARSKILVLSAVSIPVSSYAGADAAGMSGLLVAGQDLLRYAEERTSRAERELRAIGLETEARAVEGDAREILVDTARSMGADLVVVGSHGRTGLSKLVMGSVASHVVTHSPCTVVVVKPAKT